MPYRDRGDDIVSRRPIDPSKCFSEHQLGEKMYGTSVSANFD